MSIFRHRFEPRLFILAAVMLIANDDSFAQDRCDSIRREACDGESCRAKAMALQDCENVVANEQREKARQRQKDYERKHKREIDALKNIEQANKSTKSIGGKNNTASSPSDLMEKTNPPDPRLPKQSSASDKFKNQKGN